MSEIWTLYKKVVYRIGIGDLQKWSKMPISMVQLRVLIYLSIEQPVSASSLAERMNASLPNIAGILKRLENQGLVLRYPDEEDRRVTVIETTEQAKEMLDEALDDGWKNLHEALQAMSPEERQTVFEAFAILEKKLPSVQFALQGNDT